MRIPSLTCSGSACVDLHVHSDASDGSLSASEILSLATKIGLKAIAITDHDTVDGTVEALKNQQSYPLDILPGIEISAECPSGGMHILGYLFEPEAPSLRRVLRVLQEARTERNLKIVNRLQRLGINITYDTVKEFQRRGQVGRPHFAQALVQKGIVPTVEDAFSQWLKPGRPAYVPKYRLSPAEAIEAILAAGGIPVLAHPNSVNARDEAELDALLADLKAFGLKGLEVYYPEHGPEQKAAYERLAIRHALVMTGGTDFHGATKPGICLGSGKGDLRVPYQLVQALRNTPA
jgi:predicted metal-dependent phosphoesterase TrpH